jgi:hypothetical protein
MFMTAHGHVNPVDRQAPVGNAPGMTPGFFMRMAKRRIVAMRILSRPTFWLRAATLLVAIIACGWLLVPRSRITWENFGRIQPGMNDDEVAVILGPPHSCHALDTVSICEWEHGRYWIGITFDHGKVCGKSFNRATPSETFKRYAKKVGIKWQ